MPLDLRSVRSAVAAIVQARASAPAAADETAYTLAQEIRETSYALDALALSLYLAEADAGHASAMNWAAVYLADGLGCERDLPRAVQLWSRAVALGEPYAAKALAWHYHVGVGVPCDRAEALRLAELAVKGGAEKADALLRRIRNSR